MKNFFSRKSKKASSITLPKPAQVAIFLLRIGFGWFLLYSGITKLMNPEWTAAGFLGGAKTFPFIFEWFSSASNIAWVNFLNVWGQTLIGLGLLTGGLTRLASFFGIILMVLYYLPGLDFPKVEHGYLIDDHVLYIFALSVLITTRAGQYWGLDKLFNEKIKSWWI